MDCESGGFTGIPRFIEFIISRAKKDLNNRLPYREFFGLMDSRQYPPRKKQPIYLK